MPQYVYEHPAHETGDPQGFSIPGGDLVED
jgi:hypothetical protein